jgi:hypothetical protein
MGPREPRDEDPTGEELEFDGTKTVQLDGMYRVGIATSSEPGTFDLPRPVDVDALIQSPPAPAAIPTVIDKTDGDTIIEAGPPRGFRTKRNVKPR